MCALFFPFSQIYYVVECSNGSLITSKFVPKESSIKTQIGRVLVIQSIIQNKVLYSSFLYKKKKKKLLYSSVLQFLSIIWVCLNYFNDHNFYRGERKLVGQGDYIKCLLSLTIYF